MTARISRFLTLLLVFGSFVEVRISMGKQPLVSIAGAAVLILLAVQILSIPLFSLIPHLSNIVGLGWRKLRKYPPENRAPTSPSLRDMLALMGLLSTLYFAVAIHLLIHQGLALPRHDVATRIEAVGPLLTAGVVIGEVLIFVYYWRKSKLEASSSLPKIGA